MREFIAFGKSEAIVSLFFTGGLAWFMLYLKGYYSDDEVAIFGIALNWMNILSVLFVGLAISTAIFLSKEKTPYLQINYFIVICLSYIALAYLVFYFLTPNICQLYFGACSSYPVCILFSLSCCCH